MKYLIDFDGVIVNSIEIFKRDMGKKTDLDEWMEYLSNIKWFDFLRECDEIDNSFLTLKELERINKLYAIITRIHSFSEGKEKQVFLREKGIKAPIIYTLPEQRKSDVFIPSMEFVLIDDDVRNCKDWERSGGKALLFNPNIETENEKVVKSLKKLL